MPIALDGGRSFDDLRSAYDWAQKHRRKAQRYLELEVADFGGVDPARVESFRRLFADVGVLIVVTDEGSPTFAPIKAYEDVRAEWSEWQSRRAREHYAASAELGVTQGPVSRPVLDLLYDLAAPGDHRPKGWKPVSVRRLADALNADPDRYPPAGAKWHPKTVHRALQRLAAAHWPGIAA